MHGANTKNAFTKFPFKISVFHKPVTCTDDDCIVCFCEYETQGKAWFFGKKRICYFPKMKF